MDRSDVCQLSNPGSYILMRFYNYVWKDLQVKKGMDTDLNF